MIDLLENPHSYRIGKLIHKSHEKLKETNILIVGVGGIGCEILKVLSKFPIGQIHILDMDTIELSNLNRQFLFKQQHKGLSKSLVAKESIKALNPHLNIHAHHLNIKDLAISFFKKFNFIVLALDNVEARNYINKIGVRLNIPLIDAGTLAYTGNVTTIIPHATKCYSCQPKVAPQNVFPVCTIRMRPEKPIHCIVWAKMLFEAFFGPDNNQSQLKDLSSLGKSTDAVLVLQKLFQQDIINIKQAKSDTDKKLNEFFIKKIKIISSEAIKSYSHSQNYCISSFSAFDKKQSLETYIALFSESFLRLKDVKLNQSLVTFEKDDDDIIHFISSAANMRMHCFSIQQQSFNEIKNMAGNIIPAIASTNSIVSSIEILEMIKFLEKNQQKMKSYYIQNQSNKLMPLKLEKPLPECHICGAESQPVTIQCNFSKFKLQNLIQLIKETADQLEQFSINQGSKEIYNSDDPKQSLLAKTIFQIGESYEIDLVLTNEDTMKKVCTIWLIHSDLVSQIDVHNKEKLIPKKQVQIIVEEKPIIQNQDSDIVMFDDEEGSPEIQIIEKKRTSPENNNFEEDEIQRIRKIKKIQ